MRLAVDAERLVQSAVCGHERRTRSHAGIQLNLSIINKCDLIQENLVINELKLLEGPSNSMASEPQTMLTMHAFDTTFYGASLASDAVQ